jgi:mannitol operon transcriptional antiterminator
MPLFLSPRLSRLLEILLRRTEPLSVDALAGNLGCSRRTVFRELENTDTLLKSYEAHVDSVPGKGIRIVCGESRDKLLSALNSGSALPGNRGERLLSLTLELLSNSGLIQKLLYYADMLGVSESTISNDLDAIEPWLAGYHIVLERKPGQGVCASGKEADIRGAITMRFIMDGGSGVFPYARARGNPPEDIERGVRDILSEAGTRFDWMTSESHEMLTVFLMVTVERVRRGNFLREHHTGAGSFQQRLADFLAAGIERRFSLPLPPAERCGLAWHIQSCRAKFFRPPQSEEREQHDQIQSLVDKMIERFDPGLAPYLKMNEQLVYGLARHLGPALIRLEKKMGLSDPLKGQFALRYPDVYGKTRKAASVLEEYLRDSLPSSEISFIAVHFYAALAAIDEQKIHKHLLYAGLVCVAGIGVSYMLASQIRNRFKGELEIDISGWDDREAWQKADFLISTIPLRETDKPVILVQPLLGEEDYRRIQDAVNTYAYTEKGPAPHQNADASFVRRLDTAASLLSHIRMLISAFSVVSIRPDCGFEELALFAAERFTGSGIPGTMPGSESSREVYQALIDREALYSQVIADMGIVLLHACTRRVSSPVFALIVPEQGLFLCQYFRGAKSCALMLLPEQCPPEMKRIMGGISGGLIDSPDFLAAVQRGNEQEIRPLLEARLSAAALSYCRETLTA